MILLFIYWHALCTAWLKQTTGINYWSNDDENSDERRSLLAQTSCPNGRREEARTYREFGLIVGRRSQDL